MKNQNFNQNHNKAMKNQVKIGSYGICYPVGHCGREHIVDHYTLYDKTYTPDESIVLRALSMVGSKMIAQNYITVLTDVKDKATMWREDFDVSYQSEATGGRGVNECGPFMPAGRIVHEQKCIHVTYMYIEVSICYKKLIGTFKQSLLKPGMARTEDNTSLNDRVLDAILRESNKITDILIWNGDVGSAVKDRGHYDGLLKKIHYALENTQNQTLCIEGMGLAAGDCIEGKYGSYDINVPFNTDNNTTMADLEAELASLTHPTTCQPLLTVCNNGNGKVGITSRYDNIEIQISLSVTKCDGLNYGCPNTPGDGTITITEEVGFIFNDKPIAIKYTPVSAKNVHQEITKLYMKASVENPELLGYSDFYLHVATDVYVALQVAEAQLTANVNGQIRGGVVNPNPYGLRIVNQPQLPHGVMIGTRVSNIYFATDLMSDMSNTRVWVDIDCQEVRFRHEVLQGVQIDRYDETVSNLKCAPFKYNDPVDCNYDVLAPRCAPDAPAPCCG